MEFKSALRGYRKQEVQALLESLDNEHLDRLKAQQKTLEELQQQIEIFTQENKQLAQQYQAYAKHHDEVHKMLSIIKNSVAQKENEALQDKMQAMKRVHKEAQTLQETKHYIERLKKELLDIKNRNRYIDQLDDFEDHLRHS